MPEVITKKDPRIFRSQPYRDQIRAELQERISIFPSPPGLMVEQPNNDTGSNLYVPAKMKESGIVGINAYRQHFTDPHTTLRMVTDFIDYANTLPYIHGNIIQMEPYEHLRPLKGEMLSHIIPIQDVDGFRPDSPHTPATPRGIYELLRRSGRLQRAKDEGNKAVIWGKSPLVGRPTTELLLKEGFDVHIIDSKSSEEEKEKYTKQANIVVVAVGKGPRLVTDRYFNEGQNATVIDVGVNRDETSGKVVGDVDAERVLAILGPEGALTPPTGGVGPMTVEMLLVNTADAYEMKMEQAA